MMLRSIELVLPRAREAADFLTGIWGLAAAQAPGDRNYLRGSGAFPYLVALEEGLERFVRTTTFTCGGDELVELAARVGAAGLNSTRVVCEDPGGGEGIIVELPEGELFRFLVGAEEVEPLAGSDLPVKLTHVVFNSVDAERSGHAAEEALGFRVSDRTRGMVFVRCNRSHHSLAFARAGHASLNHIAFEMQDMDAVMRGVGRLRDRGLAPSWGPGRHGPGANVFAYFVAPFGAVVEFSTAVELVPEDYPVGAPEDWTWPPNRIDRWGLSDKDAESLGQAERNFRFRREWEPQDVEGTAVERVS